MRVRRAGPGAVAEPRRVFPLVPRHRLTGGTFGGYHSLRRGQGTDLAGSRAYTPGDRLAWIDWNTSARVSALTNDDAFVVREFYADEAPRVIIVADHHPAMALYPYELPWLSKPDTLRGAARAIVTAAQAARAHVGYLDLSGVESRAGKSYWLAPRRLRLAQIEQRLSAAFDAPADALERAIRELMVRRHDVPAGCFVFVVSDFLRPPPLELWMRARALRWDLVPVIVQDPVWEQSFPLIGGSVVAISDPASGRVSAVRIGKREALRLRNAHVALLASLVQLFRHLEFDPVLLGTSDEQQLDTLLPDLGQPSPLPEKTRSMKHILLTAIVGAFLVAGAAPAFAAKPLGVQVQTSVSTRFLYFADTVIARASVVIDRRRIRPESIRVTASFPDWEQVAPTQTTSLASGTLVVRSWIFRIACTAYVCLPGESRFSHGSRRWSLPQPRTRGRCSRYEGRGRGYRSPRVSGRRCRLRRRRSRSMSSFQPQPIASIRQRPRSCSMSSRGCLEASVSCSLPPPSSGGCL